MLVNIRIMIVAVADSRYGPIYNYGIARCLRRPRKMATDPAAACRPLIGYSSGGQIGGCGRIPPAPSMRRSTSSA